MSTNHHLLTSVLKTPLRKWQVTRYWILDWYDAPLEGFCELATPPISMYYKAIASRTSTRTSDTFIYEVCIVANTDPQLLALQVFEGGSGDNRAAEIIHFFQAHTRLLLQSKDMTVFTGIWTWLRP